MHIARLFLTETFGQLNSLQFIVLQTTLYFMTLKETHVVAKNKQWLFHPVTFDNALGMSV